MIQRYPHTVRLFPSGDPGVQQYDESGAPIAANPAAAGIDVPAFVDPVSGREFELAQQVAAGVSYIVFMDYREDVTAAWSARWVDRDVPLEIHDVRDQGGQEEVLALYCSRG